MTLCRGPEIPKSGIDSDVIDTSRRKLPRRQQCLVASLGLAASLLASCTSGSPGTGIHKIKHVIVIMQENRSFDSYFGTFPGADGIAMTSGVPTACVPDPQMPPDASVRTTTPASSMWVGRITPTPPPPILRVAR